MNQILPLELPPEPESGQSSINLSNERYGGEVKKVFYEGVNSAEKVKQSILDWLEHRNYEIGVYCDLGFYYLDKLNIFATNLFGGKIYFKPSNKAKNAGSTQDDSSNPSSDDNTQLKDSDKTVFEKLVEILRACYFIFLKGSLDEGSNPSFLLQSAN